MDIISMASSHPITTTIRECLLAGGIPKDARKWEVKETIGQGVEARNGDNVWRFSENRTGRPTEMANPQY